LHTKFKLPDVVLYNSADDYNKGFMQSKVMVKPDGLVFWSLPIKLRSSCKIDVTYFPFDDQVCVWKFGSWTYSGLQVDLISLKESGELTNYVVSGEWLLRSITAIRNVQYCNNIFNLSFEKISL
jgi:nicotinic acetylcholine receptor